MINATTIKSHDLNTARIPKGYHEYNQMIYAKYGYMNPSGSDGKLQITYIYYMINVTTIKSHNLNTARIPKGYHVYNQMRANEKTTLKGSNVCFFWKIHTLQSSLGYCDFRYTQGFRINLPTQITHSRLIFNLKKVRTKK